MNSSIKVSFIIPVYRAERFIAKTIKSVLSQTYKEFEAIVIDDCGGDNSIAIVESYNDKRIKVFHNERNMGIAFSRNRGLEEASGEYIALLDDDDIAMPNRLELQVAFLDAHPEIGVVSGNAQWIDENDNLVRDVIDVEKTPERIQMFFLFRNLFNNSEMTFRKNIVDKHELRYYDGYYGMEDFHFWIRFLHYTKATFLSDLLLRKRVFSENETAKNKEHRTKERDAMYLKIQKESLELNGYQVTDACQFFLSKFFSEHDFLCKNLEDLSELKLGLSDFISQTKRLNKEYLYDMQVWFANIIEDNLVSIYKSEITDFRSMINLSEKDVPSRYVYLENKVKELESWTAELQAGKDWLEKQYLELESWTAELQAGKDWLEKQYLVLKDKFAHS